jgi:uncharacterized protein (DUF885 family)
MSKHQLSLLLIGLAAISGSLRAHAAPQTAFVCKATAHEALLDQAHRYLLASLAYSPVQATQIGYHGDKLHPLDNELDDFSPETLATQRALLVSAQQCFASVKTTTPDDAADLALLQDNIASSLFQTDTLQSDRYRPQDYAELIGSALFFPLTATGGDEKSRLTALVSRMQQVPRLLTQARQNLVEADPVYIDTALDEDSGNPGVLSMVVDRVHALKPADSALSARAEAAQKAAKDALTSYDTWLKDDLSKRPHTVTWRTGTVNYAKIFTYALGPGTHDTPDSVLANAERDLEKVRAQMFAIALPLHKQWFADHSDHAELTGDALQNKILSEVIGRINDDHTEPAQLLDKVREQSKGIRDWIVQKNLMTLSMRDNMHVVPTPEFLRGVYSVAGFHSAPALDPTGEAEYWVTPIDPATPKDKAESKLREYNNWMLQYLTMHEALPGHYTQFEHANNLQPESRRVLRGLLANGAYVEGWGEYAVKEMEDSGYANHDPRFVLMVQKIRLRVIANSILDIRLQSRNMTDDEAMALMEQKAFQTHAEAEGKLRRAKLTAGQLITYYVGYLQWNAMRDKLQSDLGNRFDLKKFNDDALDEGPLPIPLLEPLLTTRLKAD